MENDDTGYESYIHVQGLSKDFVLQQYQKRQAWEQGDTVNETENQGQG